MRHSGGANRSDSARPTTAREYVHDYLRGQIVNGVLPGGARLVQTQVANDLDVSTTPVREALLDLASEGLVQFDSHRGAIVRQLNMEELWEIFELRRVLEPMVVQLAIPKMSVEDLNQLSALCDAMEATHDPDQWVPLNREFHGIFMEKCGRPRLASFVGALHDTATTFLTTSMRFRPEMIEVGNEDHRILANAAREGDVARAMACSRDHMNVTMTAVKGLFPGDPPSDMIGGFDPIT